MLDLRTLVMRHDAWIKRFDGGGGGGGGTSDHRQLTNRDASGQHPISAITGLQSALDAKAAASSLATVATSGNYNDLSNKPTIPAAQVQSDWTEADNTAVDYIKNKPTLATVATSGSYNDLTNKPTLAAVATSGAYSDLSGTPTLAAVATSGSYTDLSDKPTIPAAGVPSGGSQGQVLAKASATDYDVGWVNQSGGSATTFYGTCDTTDSTTAKVVTCSGYTLTTGAIVGILFTTANTASAPTLNINSTGAIAMRIGNSAPSMTTNVLKWSANTMLFVMYDGTYYRFIRAVSAASSNSPDGGGAWYGTCSTTASTAAKISIITNFRLTAGALVCLNCTTDNTYTSGALTLNVNSTGAKTIYKGTSPTSSSNQLTWSSGDILTFIYSGVYWFYVGTSASSGGGSGTIAQTSALLKGDGNGNAVAATAGTDYPAAGIPSGGTTGQVLTKDSGTDYDVSWQTPSGGSLEYSFVAEQVKVIDSQSVASASYYLNTVTATKAGYYPVGVVGWTSSNQYPNVYACRLSAQSLGSCDVTCGASNYTGSTRTLNVWATVLWVAQTSLSDANGVSF